METTTRRQMRADPDVVFSLAAAVERWPEILPHYRWVRVLGERPDGKLVEMAASRDGIPVRWRAIQQLEPSQRRIRFRHVGGITRGMEVAWRLRQNDEGVLVEIWHRFRPSWPLVPDRLIRLVVGEFFIHNIASKTLSRVAALTEARAGRAARV